MYGVTALSLVRSYHRFDPALIAGLIGQRFATTLEWARVSGPIHHGGLVK